MKKIIIICDICGKDVSRGYNDRRYVIKRKSICLDLFHGINRDFTKIDVCEDCINKICNSYKEKENKNEQIF